MLKPVRRRIAKAIEAGTCERAYPKGARYRENFRILLEGGSHAFVQVGALIPERQKGGIRMVINPASSVMAIPPKSTASCAASLAGSRMA